ncbi:MAG: metal-dependent hydrolase [Candidatus Promineifilaceae bacterium]|nr:metal-dependent hydrolase [Candidatus Promineifilaceae bacterium]
MPITITWHGHNTFTLDINGHKVVVDPFFAGNNPVATVSADDVEADFILQTHGHGDHIADTVPLAKRTGAMVIGNFEICNWIGGQGHEKTHALNTGGGHDFAFGHVRMTRAFHSSGLPDGSYGGDPGGFVITADGKKLYFAGDTALFSDMSLIGDLGLDLAVVPIGDNFTMGPDDAFRAVSDYLKPKAVIPCHYNTWALIEQDAGAWAERVRGETGAEVIVLDVGGSHTL